MKNKMLIISDEMFLSYSYENGNLILNNNKILNKLDNKFEIDNISSKKLNSFKASNYIKEFIKHFNYSYCIISLNNYESILNDALNKLKDLEIKTILISKPNASLDEINNMKELSLNNNLNYIIYDEVKKEQNANKLNSLILNFCA